MLLSEYQAQLATVIDHFAHTDLIVSSQLSIDARTPKMGIVSGALEFVDGARLEFNEYIDLRFRPERLNYVYHCQDIDSHLIFRYDNAAHKPALPFTCHKHTAKGEVNAADPPELSDVLDEIMERFSP
ncbi:toxin-antitoxin system TumE family protein [Geobacter argillaceus]|uniref:Uncharacterized protein n=1 Tax=Geobacter argillaceus TaxID=345631 RepID=A0A562VG53_9BACT|nr:DUF6516 family protein [Geobacter argillaceus]TWJ16697.1 hypothetical protein JN12_03269 [Geobacter argillaceus]